MFQKKRKYDIEHQEEFLILDSKEANFKNVPLKEGEGVWVEKNIELVTSTTGSGGSDLYLSRKEGRWKRNEEIDKNKQEQEEIEKIATTILINEKNEKEEKLLNIKRTKRLKKKELRRSNKINNNNFEE